MKRLIYFLMALLGFGASGCASTTHNPFDDDDMVAEYGCPHVVFHLSARVVDAAGTPIKGIEVHCDGAPLGYENNTSDAEGNIHIVDAYVWPGAQYEVEFVDPDGVENGGEFETLQLDITDKIEQMESGSGNWYEGDFRAELGEVTMTLKNENK